jgi:hypothetical protein
MEDRKRVGALGIVCLAALVTARTACASSAPFLQVAPLVYGEVIAHDGHAHRASPTTPAPVAASPTRRPLALIPLYGAFAALQFADARSTTLTLRQGGVEMNPLMSGVAGSPKGLVAVKLATTVSTIVATELLWRSHPRAAVIAMAILTSGYSVVVAHNYRQLR